MEHRAPPQLPAKTWYAAAYLTSNALSILGNSLITVVLPVLIISRLGSPTWAGIVAVATTSAQVCAGFLGGAIADRINRRNLSLAADLLSAFSVFSLFFIDWAGLISAVWFITLGIIGAFADMPGQTARQALGPQVATSSSIKYETITGYFQTLQGGALVIGPALAGIFLLLPNPSWALIVTGTCSLLAAGTTVLLPSAIGEYEHNSVTETIIQQTTTTLNLIRTTALLRFVILFSLCINVLYAVTQNFVLPTHYTLLGQRDHVGWIVAVLGVGMVIGGIGYGILSKKLRKSTLFRGGAILCLFGALQVLSLNMLPVVMIGAFFLGSAFSILNATATVAIMTSLPEGKRGSVMGIFVTLIFATFPLGFGISTLLYAYFGLIAVRLALATGFVVVTVWTLSSPNNRALDSTTANARLSPPDTSQGS